jgi:hypothetical protein
VSDPRGASEIMDLGTLPQVWASVDMLHREVLVLHDQHPRGPQLTARFIDEIRLRAASIILSRRTARP